MKKYKSVKQNDLKDCGAACILTVLKQYKSDLSISSIRETIGTSNTGTNLLGIVRGLEEYNFEAKAIKADIEIFEDVSLPYPAIAYILKDGMLLHFVVIHKVYKN
ncbi:ABC transporter, ATP-binding protein/permease [Enterococcus durans]|uniref:ABC transporter, ATP-binding protein/permease n=1 Tax=Enterococcus durans TaxID=53345 RepID=A0A377KI46_9ENTE|nr:cysteine peptidase family C39 domain-containing protein [Enterococcus durans]STP28858.1 ABC transporter, ATP-binding protein/permease [Enterococcus durans]